MLPSSQSAIMVIEQGTSVAWSGVEVREVVVVVGIGLVFGSGSSGM